MPLTPRPDVAANVFALEDGTLAHATITVDRNPLTHRQSYHATAAVVDAQGAVQTGLCGHAVTSQCMHTMSADAVERIGHDAIRREVLLAVLGEPATLKPDGEPLIPWSAEYRRDVSLRSAIALSANCGTDDDLATLLEPAP